MGLADHEFNISPEQVAGLVTHACDLQGTADLIEGQIAGFLDNVVGNIGGADDLGSIGRRNYDRGGGGPGDAGLNQNIGRPRRSRDVYGVGLFGSGGGSWAGRDDETPGVRRQITAANQWGRASRRADADVVRAHGGDPGEYATAVETARNVFNAQVDTILQILISTGGRLPGSVDGGIAASVAKDIFNRTHAAPPPGGSPHTPPPDGDDDSSGSAGPAEFLWQSLSNLRNFGGRVEPVDANGVGSLGVRVPAIFRANDPTDEYTSSSGGAIYWWGAELIDPDPNQH